MTPPVPHAMTFSGFDRAGWRDRLVRWRARADYDLLARAPLLAWFAVCCAAMTRHLLAELAVATGWDGALRVLARGSGLCFVVFVIVALLRRLPPVARASGISPRLVAVAGTFSITALAFFPQTEMAPATAVASLALTILGNAVACYALVHLGRSLSVMAEARRLVTSGPYAVVRHPLYLGEGLASLGLLLQFLSPLAAMLWVLHIVLQVRRMRYEEGVLSRAFPEYSAYSRQVPAVLPYWFNRAARLRLG